MTVLTTAANAVCAPVHDRMPCVLAGPDAEAAWLSADVDVDGALDLLRSLDAERTAAAPANPAVNKAGVEGPELLVVPPGSRAGAAHAMSTTAPDDLVGRGAALATLARVLDEVAAGGPGSSPSSASRGSARRA